MTPYLQDVQIVNFRAEISELALIILILIWMIDMSLNEIYDDLMDEGETKLRIQNSWFEFCRLKEIKDGVIISNDFFSTLKYPNLYFNKKLTKETCL